MTTAREVLRNAKDLPTISPVVAQLSQLLHDETASASDFQRVVKPDPALTANLLRLANSAFFGVKRQVTSVRQAIALLGVKRVFELAISASFGKILPKTIPGYEMDAQAFWMHCIGVAIISERLAKEAGLRPPDMTFTAGLLHDIGKLATGILLLEKSSKILDEINTNSIPLIKAESNTLGTNHAEVGELISEEWNLPQAVSWATRWHHNPNDAPDDVDRVLVDLIHLADNLTHSLGLGTDIGELSRKVENNSIKRTGINVQVLERVAGETLDQIKEMGSILSDA